MMAHLKRYSSNRLEILAGRLASCMRQPLSSPLTPEIVVVQSKGMERWLSMELARHHGICANMRFPFPNAVMEEIFRILLPEYREAPAYDPEIMTWRIMKQLPVCLENPVFTPIRDYLRNDRRDVKLYQLAVRIADLFDQYLLFRPEMMLAWEKGLTFYDEESWQAELWRRLRTDDTSLHPALLRDLFLEKVRKPLPANTPLPERISVFGVSWLPHFHMEIFYELSRHRDIHLFSLSPCQEFWTDIRSERERDRSVEKIREKTGRHDLSEEDLYLEGGNSLLASLGLHGRDFSKWLLELPAEEEENFEEPGDTTLLQAVQSDILKLRERGGKGQEKSIVKPGDRSLQIHSCHSPMREVEVLHDQLLALFENDPDIQPHDVLVMAPDMDRYAPLIQAVFDTPADPAHSPTGPPGIPFTLTDLTLKKENRIADVFLKLLALAGSRFEMMPVLALLESPFVQRSFGLSEEDLERIRCWLEGVRIRWGMDDEHRRHLGLPGTIENTWKAGMEMLLLGYAMPEKDDRLFCGILPYDAVEGLETRILGPLAAFLDRLVSKVMTLARPRPLNEWAADLSELLPVFFAVDDDAERDVQTVRRTLQKLMLYADRSGFKAPVDIEIIRRFLGQHLDQQGSGTGYISGGVTCCAMLPMRSIPFKMIALLGMNHDGYPRASRTLGFNLITRHPQPGDRSRRNDDRYLFLEALLSARHKLIISYVGQGIADNSLLPPSVLVSELLDYVAQGFDFPGNKTENPLITVHRLQAFHKDYFTEGTGLFSYSEENGRAAHRLDEAYPARSPFIATPLAPPEEEDKAIDITDLIHFFRNPCRFLMERRLATTLREEGKPVDDRESFELNGLEKYGLDQQLVGKALAGRNLPDLFPAFRASGQLPHGNPGVQAYARLARDAASFAGRLQPYLSAGKSDPIGIHLDIGRFQLGGLLDNLYANDLFLYRSADLKAKDHLWLWISHLALNAMPESQHNRRSRLAGWDGLKVCQPVENAAALLEQLLTAYAMGLSAPLTFFPDTSWCYAEQRLLKGKSDEDAIRQARSVWTGDEHRRGESRDPYYRQCFDERLPLDDDFKRLAITIYAPLFRYMTHDDSF